MNQSVFGITMVFTTYKDLGPARNAFTVIVFCMYVASIFANITLLFIICSETSLHKPMYIFLFNLVCTGLVGSTAIWPQVVFNLISDSQTSSYPACLLQVFLVSFYGACTFVNLTVMAYDRYVSICKPLQYHTIMTPCRVKQLVAVSTLMPTVALSGQIYLTSRIPLCSYSLHKLFCDNLSVSNLACGKNNYSILGNAYGIVLNILVVVLPICLIILSYTRIISVSLRISNEARKKAFSTCAPHLIVFVNFSVASFFTLTYNRVNSYVSSEMHVFLALQIILIPPLLHPIIYGMRTKEIRICFSKAMKRRVFPFPIYTFSSTLH